MLFWLVITKTQLLHENVVNIQTFCLKGFTISGHELIPFRYSLCSGGNYVLLILKTRKRL